MAFILHSFGFNVKSGVSLSCPVGQALNLHPIYFNAFVNKALMHTSISRRRNLIFKLNVFDPKGQYFIKIIPGNNSAVRYVIP